LAYAGGLVAVGNPPIDDTIPIRVALKHATAGSSVGIASGAGHTCAIVNHGVMFWGNNRFGEPGNDSKPDGRLPVWVSGLTP
jgi:alpha-tubulin suppressor-like RCC1 family protein